MTGDITRMRNRALSMAWEKWQQTAAEMKEQAMLLRRGLMRMINAKLTAAFASWREQAVILI